PRLAGFVLPPDEVLGRRAELALPGSHALFRYRTRVVDLLLADFAPPRHHGLVVLVRGPAVEHAARAEVLAKLRVLRVVRHLRLFFRVQVIEIAEELVEAVIGREHVVQVAEVVLAELPGRVALLFEQRRDRNELVGHADRRRRNTDLREARAIDALARDERRPSR